MPRMSVYIPDDQLARVRKRYGDETNLSAIVQTSLTVLDALDRAGKIDPRPMLEVLTDCNALLERLKQDRDDLRAKRRRHEGRS